MRKQKVFSFGKVDYYGTGRKINEVEVEVNIRDWNGYDELSICAGVWNMHHTDYVTCGQCLDDIKDNTCKGHNKLFLELHRLWKLYHLTKLSDIPADDLQKVYKLMEVEA